MEEDRREMNSSVSSNRSSLRRCPGMEDLRRLSGVVTEEQVELLKEAFPDTDWSFLPRSKGDRRQGVKERSFPYGALI